MKLKFFFVLILFVLSVNATFSQTTEFTYQGKLNDNGNPANASYDMQFKLFDATNNGNQVGSTITRQGIQVTNGIFTVRLDFGANFDGTDRFLEISVKQAGGQNYTLLTPRQPVTSAPYSIQAANAANATTATTAINATQLGGIAANQYVQTNDARLSDARLPLPGSSNYIRNTNSQQTASFNISGDGVVGNTFTAGGTISGNIVNVNTQFNINNIRALSFAGSNSLFVGRSSGVANTSGDGNTFVGSISGQANTTGSFNSFFGAGAGFSNVSGGSNSFFGANAGRSNTSDLNSFFGASAGFNNSSGERNSFFGNFAGRFTTTGNSNTFLGDTTGNTNTTGSFNTLIGQGADVGSNNLSFATVIGAGAIVGTSNTVVLGRNVDTVQVPGNLSVTGNLFASGTNLTSLNAGSITNGILSVNNGGTGLSSSGSLGNFLRSNGSNWSSSPLGAGDIPDLSANYIKNTTNQQATSNFNISGNGTIGGILNANNGAFTNAVTANSIGIGTNAPSVPLDIFGNVALNGFMLRLRGGSDPNQGLLYSGAIDGPEFRGFGGFIWTSNGGNTELMRLSSNGNLGIGTNNPSSRLSVAGDATISNTINANTVNSTTQYNIGGVRVYKTVGASFTTIAGVNSGSALTNGVQNTFVGSLTGNSTTIGSYNTFVGVGAGNANVSGERNSYFGNGAGQFNTSSFNSYFGNAAGFQNTGGSNNSFFGNNSGANGTTGSDGTFFGANAGVENLANGNSFFGKDSGLSNTTGFSNAFFGYATGKVNVDGFHNSFFGYNAGSANTSGDNNTFIGWFSGTNNTTENNNTLIGKGTNINAGVNNSTAIGVGAVVTVSNQIVLGTASESVRIPGLLGGGANHLCFDVNNVILGCSSSLRYKTNLAPYTRSLDVIKQLRPISFDWKSGGKRDIGFGAEDVEKIDPLLITYNANGQVEGVKYDRLSTVFVNAFKEQQTQIEQQQKQIKEQQNNITELKNQVELLKKLVCADHPQAEVCKP